MSAKDLQSLLIAQPGVLQLGPDRHLVIAPDTLGEIQKGVEDRLGPKASEYLYSAGSVWAVREIKRLRSLVPQQPTEQLARMFCQHATALGWGEWQLEAIQEQERSLLVRVARSPFAEAYGQSDSPVCHLISGAVAGMVEALFALPATSTELRCRSQGAADCQFAATGNDLAASDSWAW